MRELVVAIHTQTYKLAEQSFSFLCAQQISLVSDLESTKPFPESADVKLDMVLEVK